MRIEQQLSDNHKKMINLAHDWLRSYLPHVLQKIDRVSFGIMNKEDYDRAVKADPHMPRTRVKLAIPFVGKGAVKSIVAKECETHTSLQLYQMCHPEALSLLIQM